MLRQNGLALGGSLENAIVLGETGVLNNALRFEDEFVRHKILDAVGDLALVGYPVIGHLVAHRAGHALHTEFAAKILEETQSWRLIEAPGDAAVLPAGVRVEDRRTAALPTNAGQIPAPGSILLQWPLSTPAATSSSSPITFRSNVSSSRGCSSGGMPMSSGRRSVRAFTEMTRIGAARRRGIRDRRPRRARPHAVRHQRSGAVPVWSKPSRNAGRLDRSRVWSIALADAKGGAPTAGTTTSTA